MLKMKLLILLAFSLNTFGRALIASTSSCFVLSFFWPFIWHWVWVISPAILFTLCFTALITATRDIGPLSEKLYKNLAQMNEDINPDA